MITRECDRCHKTEVLIDGSYPKMELRATKDFTKISLPWSQVCGECNREIANVIEITKDKYWKKYERQAVEEIKSTLALKQLKS